MEYPSYDIESTPDKKIYWFTSFGLKNVTKVILMQQMLVHNRFNLAMGDVLGGKLSFENRTDNRDLETVFGSIVTIVIDFFRKYPDAELFIAGNTDAKARMYRMQVSKHLEEIQENYEVYGQTRKDGPFFEYRKGKKYFGILIKRK